MSTLSRFAHRLLDWIASRLKGQRYSLDPALRTGALVGIASRRVSDAARGLTLALRFRAVVFRGPNVRVVNARYVRLGRSVTLARGVYIDGLSKNGILIDDNVSIGPYTIIQGTGVLTNLGAGCAIGSGSGIGAFSFIGCGGGVRVGKNVIMGQYVSFHAEAHNFDEVGVPIKAQGVTRRGIVIEDDCWVGAKATFLDGAYVGRGSVVAAGALVRERFPEFSVLAGVPARVVRRRQGEDGRS